jgi:sigma-B regulation protein RsbU (phosphoserine phosphatase)
VEAGAPKLSTRLEQAEEELHSLSAEILERYEEATLIYRLSERLGAVLGEHNIARLVLEDASRVLGARCGEIWLGSAADVTLGAAVPPHRPVRWEPDQDGARFAMEENRPWSREATADEESVAAVPLPGANGESIGALVLHGRAEGRSYRSGEVKLLTALASLTAAFIRNDRLAEEVRRAEARRREDEIARQIHRSLLPAADPDFEGLEIAASCVAAENIGGDFYGYLPMPDGSLGVAMADVSGHGVGAALYMAAAKGALQAEARRVFAPGDVLRRVNEALIADFERSDVFATAFFARFYPGGRRFSFASGGHNPPLLVRADGDVELLHRGGAALGVLPDAAYEEEIRQLGEGDTLVIYTDGLVEARDGERRLYGQERLVREAREWRSFQAAKVRDRLLESLSRHCNGAAPHDDVTLMVIRGRAHRHEPRRGGERT